MTALRLQGAAPVLPRIDEIEWCAPARLVAALPATPGTVFLDSAMEHPVLGRWSYLALDPFGHFLVRDGRASWNGDALAEAPLAALRALLGRFAIAPGGEAPAFRAGASGQVSYEAGALFERLPVPRASGPAAPDIELWFHDIALVFDLAGRRSFIVSTGWPETDPARRATRRDARAAWLREWLARAADAPPRPGVHLPRDSWRSNMSRPVFEAAVARTRDLILAGDIFQANIAQRFSAELPAGWHPVGLYAQLRAANPATFGAYIAGTDQTILSMSPERFLSLRDGIAETRPIKGTRPRGVGPEHDAALGQALAESAKDRAENLMIVDLMRNDLSRVCAAGSVRVPELFASEKYATVHHLVSTVVGTLAPGADALDLVRAAFPAGSITGAPKVRAMEIIAELEPVQRGVYCGSIGYWSVTGALDTSVAIRTAVALGDRVYFSAGGGIVADSEAEQEYRETLDKARGMIAALSAT
jgi:para-aminobenzoate synthetase component 1